MSNRLDPDQARRLYVPDLGLICLQRLSADDTQWANFDIRKKILVLCIDTGFYLILTMSLSVYFQLFPCHLCEKDYKWRSSLDKHLKGCHGEAQFECQSCSKAFRYKTCLEKHVATKHNLKEFMCDLCGAKYSSKWGLTRHCRARA